MTKPTDCDVLIVGGGPAGASTALHLVRAERVRADRITIVDKAVFPRDKPCAGAISEFGITALHAVGVRIASPSQRMRGVRVLLDESVGETMHPMGIIVRRLEFDAELLDHARAAGVRVREGESVQGIDRVASGFHVTTTVGTIATRYVAACDGVAGPTRRLLGLREPARKGHLYVLDTTPGPADSAMDRGFVDFDLSVCEGGFDGYYWDFPTLIHGVPHVSRGIYHANLSPRSDLKAALARALSRRGVDIATVRLRPFSTRPFVGTSTLSVSGAVLVGEAAGIDQITGEGIAQALAMGAMAARHLARALRTGHSTFLGYDNEARSSTMGRHLLQSARLAPHVYSPRGEPARQLLLRSPHAREAAVRWYNGGRTPLSTKMQLGLGLVRHVLS